MEEERTITLDLGSSPDPLIDPALSPPMMPPSHIKKKSPAAQRLYTVLAPSPRKQTFELDVGNELAPQKLLVTVEAEDDRSRSTGTSRRLFQSPTPKRRATPRRATTVSTTTVPLRGLSDDEGGGRSNATPKRRGRPRKSGTPVPTRRKWPGTPARSRKSGAHMSVSPEKDILTSDAIDQSTPRPSGGPGRVAKRKASSPPKDGGAPASQPRKRGRPRKETLNPDDTAHSGPGRMPQPAARDNGSIAAAHDGTSDRPGDDMDEDIWLATMSDQPTPAARRQQKFYESGQPAADHYPELEPQSPRTELDYQDQYDWPEMGDGPDSHSAAGFLPGEDYDDHDVGEDTIMAGEEFTMISLGSLPSMQPNSSVMAPQHQEELGEATSMIISEALEYLRRSRNKSTEEDINEESAAAGGRAEAAPTAAEAAEEIPIQQPEEPQHSPPAARSPQAWWNRSPRRSKAQPLAKQLAHKTLQQAERQSPAPRPQQTERAEPQDASAYEDSFSSIPETVLAAATPRRPRQLQSSQGEERAVEDIQPSIERPSRVNHSNPQSETNRLLTPDETPSPVPSDAADPEPQNNPPIPALDVDVPSSPPIGSPLQHPTGPETHHIRRNSTETPADQLTFSASPNTGIRAVPPISLPSPEPQRRPTLSPIVRAGRALQLITSDPPSPPGRDSVLGSPFRGSSVPKSSQSPAPVRPPQAPAARASRSPTQSQINTAAQSPQRSWLAHLSQVKDFFVRSAQSLSPARRVSVSGTEGMDDPFGPDPGESTGSGSVRGTLFSALNARHQDRDATISIASSPRADSVHSEDAMTRQGAGSRAVFSQRPTSPHPIDFANSGFSGAGRGWPRDTEPSPNQAESAMAPEAPEPQADLGQQAEVHEEEQEEEEEDIWAIEAQRPTPYAPRNGPSRREPIIEPPRRGNTSSMSRQNGRYLSYNDEQEQLADVNVAPPEKASSLSEKEGPSIAVQTRGKQVPVRFERNSATNEEEEFSLLAQNRQKKAPAPPNPPGRKPDLSAFFSSPALLPEMPEAPGAGASKPLDSRGPDQSNRAVGKPRTMAVQKPRPSGHGLFSQYLPSQAQTQMSSVPQKWLEIGTRERSVDLFSPRKASERNITEHPAPPPPRSPSVERLEEARPVHVPQQMGRVPRQQSASPKMPPAPVLGTASPESAEEESPPARIPQKMNFTPRQRQSNGTLFQPKPLAPTNSLFGNNQISAFFSQTRTQTQRQSRRQEQDQEEQEDEETSFAPPPKAVAHRAVSPAKSSFRSPLKPKTPGRVVEFTSSTLSPHAQAQARAERHASMSSERAQDDRVTGRGRGSGTSNATGVEQTGRHQPSESPSVSSPSPSPSPEPRPRPRPHLHQHQRQVREPQPSPEQEEQTHLPAPPRGPSSFPSTSFTRPSTTSSSSSQSRPQSQSQAQSTPVFSLSPTQWTRAHWLRLDELLQARKRGILQLQLEASRSRSRPRNNNSSSANSRASRNRHLLGKIVTSQGESMVLEQWHLDVVDAFWDELPDGTGWDEETLAKRVFALLVGEERRRLGLVPSRRGNSSLNGEEGRRESGLLNGTGGVEAEAESDGDEIDWEAV